MHTKKSSSKSISKLLFIYTSHKVKFGGFINASPNSSWEDQTFIKIKNKDYHCFFIFKFRGCLSFSIISKFDSFIPASPISLSSMVLSQLLRTQSSSSEAPPSQNVSVAPPFQNVGAILSLSKMYVHLIFLFSEYWRLISQLDADKFFTVSSSSSVLLNSLSSYLHALSSKLGYLIICFIVKARWLIHLSPNHDVARSEGVKE